MHQSIIGTDWGSNPGPSSVALHVCDNLHEPLNNLFTVSQSREDQLKMRLRSKSARVRAPAAAFSAEEEDDVTLTPVEQLQHPHTPDKLDPPPALSQTVREEAEGREQVREAAGDGRECKEETSGAIKREKGKEGGDERWRAAGEGDWK